MSKVGLGKEYGRDTSMSCSATLSAVMKIGGFVHTSASSPAPKSNEDKEVLTDSQLGYRTTGPVRHPLLLLLKLDRGSWSAAESAWTTPASFTAGTCRIYHLGRRIVAYNLKTRRIHISRKSAGTKHLERTTLATFSTNALSAKIVASLIA
jgi:hypothetical protein